MSSVPKICTEEEVWNCCQRRRSYASWVSRCQSRLEGKEMGVPSCLRRNPTPVRRENLSHEKRWSKISWNRRTNKLNQSRYLFYVFKLFLIKFYTNVYLRKIKYDLLSSSLSDLKVIRFIRETIWEKHVMALECLVYFTFPPFSNSPAACYYIPLSLSLSTDICIAMC